MSAIWRMNRALRWPVRPELARLDSAAPVRPAACSHPAGARSRAVAPGSTSLSDRGAALGTSHTHPSA
jgi:hypothetical protein